MHFTNRSLKWGLATFIIACAVTSSFASPMRWLIVSLSAGAISIASWTMPTGPQSMEEPTTRKHQYRESDCAGSDHHGCHVQLCNAAQQPIMICEGRKTLGNSWGWQ